MQRVLEIQKLIENKTTNRILGKRPQISNAKNIYSLQRLEVRWKLEVGGKLGGWQEFICPHGRWGRGGEVWPKPFLFGIQSPPPEEGKHWGQNWISRYVSLDFEKC